MVLGQHVTGELQPFSSTALQATQAHLTIDLAYSSAARNFYRDEVQPLLATAAELVARVDKTLAELYH